MVTARRGLPRRRRAMPRRPVAIASAAWPPPSIPARAPWTVRTPASGSSPSPTAGRWRCAATAAPVHPGRAVRQGQPLPGRGQRARPADHPLVRVGPRASGRWRSAGELGRGGRPGRRPGCAPASTQRPGVGPAVLLRRHHGVGAGLDDGPPALRPPGGVPVAHHHLHRRLTGRAGFALRRLGRLRTGVDRRGETDRPVGGEPALHQPAPLAVRAAGPGHVARTWSPSTRCVPTRRPAATSTSRRCPAPTPRSPWG